VVVVKRSCRGVVARDEREASPVLSLAKVMGLGVRARDGSAVAWRVEVIGVGEVMRSCRVFRQWRLRAHSARAATDGDDDTAAA
jgi:hypothetical protein